jgi:VWFA-related protein
MLMAALLAALCSGPLVAGEKKSSQSEKPKAGAETSALSLKVPVNVVVVSAIATDKQGNPTRDLSAEDFKVYEDGKPLPIHTFARESYKPIHAAGAEKTQGAAAPEGEITGARPHYVALMIDDLNTPAFDSLSRAVEAIKSYVSGSIQEGDQVSVASTSGRVQVPFTSDREVLRDQLAPLPMHLDQRRFSQGGCAHLTESQALAIEKYLTRGAIPSPSGGSDQAIKAYLEAGGCRFNSLLPEIQVAIAETVACQHLESGFLAIQRAADQLSSEAVAICSEVNFRHRIMLNTLRQYVRSMRHFEGRKSLILFSEGFAGDPVRYELQGVVDAALRSNVYLSAVDIRGLYVEGVDAASSVHLPAGRVIENKIGIVNGRPIVENVPVLQILASKILTTSNQQSAQKDPLAQVASETGGIFFHNNNDLCAGIKRAVDHETFYYILTYSSPSTQNDGRYHKIKLELSRPGVKLKYREGYYAPREQISSERRKKEDIIEALHAPGNLNEIPIQLSYQFNQISDSLYQLSLLTKINVRRIEFLGEDTRQKNSLDLVVAAFDENDKWIDGIEKVVEFNLLEPSYAAMLQYGFGSKVNFNLPPGRYKVRSVVRESLKRQMGSISRLIEVP